MKKSQQWAREILGEYRGGNRVILDLESTGLGSDDELIQVAVVGLDGFVYYDELVKPTIPIPAEATAIHGITNEMVADSLPLSAPKHAYLFGLLTGATVLTFNAEYDRRILAQSCIANQIGYADAYQWECVMKKYAAHYGEINRRYGGYKWQSLTNACRQQGVPVQDAHSALGDALMTLELLKAMAGAREGVK